MKNSKINWKTILGALLLAALAYLVLSGKLSAGSGGSQESQGATPADIPVVVATTSGETRADSNIPLTSTAAKTTEKATEEGTKAYTDYRFRSKSLLNSHYDKHGIEMGFKSAGDYEKAASDVINNPAALYKTEKEDGDHVYYLVSTNEFVVLSKDGYIRTYFKPDQGKKYFDRQ